MAGDREELEALRRLAELEAKAGIKTSPKTKREEQDAMLKEVMGDKGWGKGFGPAVYELGGKVTDVTGSPAAGAITNFVANAIPAFATSGRLDGATPLLAAPAQRVMQSAVKPSLAHRKSGDAADALKTMLSENIYPTPGGMDKAANIATKLDNQVQAAIANSPATVKTADIASRLNDPYRSFRTQMAPQDDLEAIRRVADNFWTNPQIAGKTEIPVQLAHDLKRGTYAALGKKSYGEVKGAAEEAQKALARGAREEVGAAVPNALDPLKRQASLMNVRDVAQARSLGDANNNLLGLAALRADHIPSAALTMADRIAAIKAFLAMQMYGGSKAHVLGPLGVTGGVLSPQDPRGVLYQQ